MFVRQIDAVNEASKLIRPQDVITDVNSVNVRGMKLRDVLKVFRCSIVSCMKNC